jgi:hypothetical protein
MDLKGVAVVFFLVEISVGSHYHNSFSSDTFHAVQQMSAFIFFQVFQEINGQDAIH